MTIAELISSRLANGLPHPGYPNTEQGPSVIRLPLFRLAGMPDEMVKQIDETVKMIGEAIVHVVETEGETELIPRAELEALKAELAQLKEQEQPK